MSVFDEQPPIINLSSFSSWLKKNYSFYEIIIAGSTYSCPNTSATALYVTSPL